MNLFQPYTEWLETNPFYVKDSWDFEHGRWGGAGNFGLFPRQKAILGYALKQIYNERGEPYFPYNTTLYSTIKKSGKTIISASIGAWFADQAPSGSEIYVIANSLEHAEGRVMHDLKYHYLMWNQEHSKERKAKVNQYRIELPNGTFIQTLGVSYRSSSGSRHGLTLWDELWGNISELDRRLWDEMTPISTIPYGLRFIATYAGFYNESGLLWDLYQAGVGEDELPAGQGVPVKELEGEPCWTNGRLFTYWNHEPILPWQDEQYYLDQSISLRPAAFLRLHENRWVTTHETFIDPEYWDMAAKAFAMPHDQLKDSPYQKFSVSVAVDAAPKHDCTAVVGVTFDIERNAAVLLWHKIWTPRSDQVFDLDETVEAYILQQKLKWHLDSIVYDPTQLHQLMTRLSKKGLACHEFVQNIPNMTMASQSLYDVLRYQKFLAYPDEEARSHVMNSVAEQKGTGFRIVKEAKSRITHKPIDFTVALAMAVYDAISRMTLACGQIVRIESPFADATAWPVKDPSGFELPWPLRSD